LAADRGGRESLSRDERNLMAKYGCLTEDNQRVIQATMDAMMAVPETGKKEIPA
jgi:hypothetical protein